MPSLISPKNSHITMTDLTNSGFPIFILKNKGIFMVNMKVSTLYQTENIKKTSLFLSYGESEKTLTSNFGAMESCIAIGGTYAYESVLAAQEDQYNYNLFGILDTNLTNTYISVGSSLASGGLFKLDFCSIQQISIEVMTFTDNSLKNINCKKIYLSYGLNSKYNDTNNILFGKNIFDSTNVNNITSNNSIFLLQAGYDYRIRAKICVSDLLIYFSGGNGSNGGIFSFMSGPNEYSVNSQIGQIDFANPIKYEYSMVTEYIHSLTINYYCKKTDNDVYISASYSESLPAIGYFGNTSTNYSYIYIEQL